MVQLEFTQDNYSRCKHSALYSLGMREHSRQELLQKLQKKPYSHDVDLEQLLDELEESDYLNEIRFVQNFIRNRASRGQGTLKISNELRLRGVNASLVHSLLHESEVDWYALATEQLQKKFGEDKAGDFKEKGKRMRFLSSRGFSADIVREVVD